jgi:pimeloyl-ACP methyl ester carboxylesterase
MAMAVGTFTSDAARERFAAAYREALAELPEPDAVEDVDTSFGTVRGYRFGPPGDVPLVLLPGKSASAPMWQPNLPGLRRIAPLVALDLLGEPGRSVQRRPILDRADQAAWLAETFAALGLPAAHLLGVSFGGWSAVNLAIHRPDLVRSLSVLDPANTFGRIGPKAVLFSLGMLAVMPGAVRDRSLRWLSGGAPAQDSAVGRLIDTGMTGFRPTVPAPQYPTDAELRRITAPALVVIAGRSIIHNPTRAARRARLLPNARVELWPAASHALTGEFPDRIAERVAALLDSLPAAG